MNKLQQKQFVFVSVQITYNHSTVMEWNMQIL